MEKLIKYLMILSIFCFINKAFTKNIKDVSQHLSYISPVPGSELNSPQTNIIIKSSYTFQQSGISAANIAVKGTLSGNHNGNLYMPDKNSIIFKPSSDFTYGEKVFVTINKILLSEGKYISNYTFNFIIAGGKANFDYKKMILHDLGIKDNQNNFNLNIPGDTLPDDFPRINVLQYDNPTPGKIFLCNFSNTPPLSTPYLLILNNSGNPIKYKRMQGICFDFKPYTGNMYTYYGLQNQPGAKFYKIDSLFNPLDSFFCGNGYGTDEHEIRLLPNNHAFIMSYDPEIVDMSKIVQGGKPNSTVIGLIIQEIDNNKNVVWQWRSWDHYKITDATHENLDTTYIDYVHGNAIEIDNDGNILVSCRHMDEITKINYQDGSIIWRWGGKNNQFTFLNDSIRFSHQHAIRVLPDGHYIFFDNGNYYNPPFSRAVEYSLDPVKKTCNLVWEFRNNEMTFGGFMGYVERLSNGNTLIGWGGTNPSVTEVTPEGTKTLEISLPQNVYSYRAFKLESNGIVPPVNNLISEYFLTQNFPNPFNPVTTIEYYIPVQAHVVLKVYDITGKLVLTPVNENQNYGRYEVTINSTNLSSGVYFYRLSAGNYTDTKKMVVVK